MAMRPPLMMDSHRAERLPPLQQMIGTTVGAGLTSGGNIFFQTNCITLWSKKS